MARQVRARTLRFKAERCKAERCKAARWLKAAAWACAAHAVLLSCIVIGVWIERGRLVAQPPSIELELLPRSVAPDELPLLEAWPEAQLAVVPPPAELPVAEQAAQATQPLASAIAPAPGLPTPAAAAPDRGGGQGRTVPDLAWRRDSSTLHDRLTDGATHYQPAHSRTAAHAKAPQAVRREVDVGAGDAPRASQAHDVSAPSIDGMPDPTPAPRGGEGVEAPPAALPPHRGAEQDVAAALPSRGPLAADEGTSSFDVARRGAAADDQAVRSTSAEPRPSIMDLSLATARGHGVDGAGAAARAGAVAKPTTGGAPALAGHLGPVTGAGEAAAARERARAQYEREIQGRVNRTLIWPRRLAIRLEQGETMLRFTVEPNGTIAGAVGVTKSAGFDEFDQAAVDAVRRAAPFPPIPTPATEHPRQPLSVSLRVTFSNPVIR
ncbi:MAG TPA: TonB family protein [Polyangia bacterium]|jgi:TonB family protein